jgi:hypothetical protein
MSVRVITLFRKRQFDFSFLAADTQHTITLRRAVRIPSFYYYWLGVRLHNISSSLSGSFNLELHETLPSAEDHQHFVSGSPSFAVDVDYSMSAPMLISQTATDLGAYQIVTLTASKASSGSLYAELSAVLVARTK